MTVAKKQKPEPGLVRRIIIYENRKSDPVYFDASTEELEAGAYLALFNLLNESWRVYDSIKDEEKPYYKRPEGHPDGCMCEKCVTARKEEKAVPAREKERLVQFDAFTRAKKGEASAARALLTMRKDYEYENFKIDFVESATSTYPPREWGVTKPCEEAFVAENGIYQWALHGRIGTRELRETRGEYGYHGPRQEEALQYLTKDGPMKLDPKTKKVLDLGDEIWSFRARKAGWDDGEWMYRALCSDREHSKTAIAVLEKGSMKPGKVIHLTGLTCGGCRRDMERFNRR